MIRVSGQSKSRPVKAAGAESCCQRRNQKLHAAVAKSTFASQNAQNTTISDLFWNFRCSKMARGCGAKHICKSKCTKHDVFGPLWYVLMLKNCTRLWRKAHLQVKMRKTPQSRTYFGISDVQKWHVAVARSTFASQNAQNMTCLDHFGTFLMLKNGTPLWRKAHLQVKMYKTRQLRSTFCSSAVEKMHAAVAKKHMWK